MKKDPYVYLEHMLECADAIEAYTKKISRANFLKSSLTQDAVVKRLTTIGEAANRVPKSFQTKEPKIPWKSIIGMRNIMVHDYEDVSMAFVWDTVIEDIPKLKKHLVEALEKRP